MLHIPEAWMVAISICRAEGIVAIIFLKAKRDMIPVYFKAKCEDVARDPSLTIFKQDTN